MGYWNHCASGGAELGARPERIHEILVEGSKRARVVADETMQRVRDAIKINYT